MKPHPSKLIVKPGRALRGECELPGDKSISHRAALLAALASGESCIDHFLVAGVTQAMLNCLSELGVKWHLEGEQLRIEGKGPAGLRASRRRLDCGNSATTLRLLAGALSAASIPAVLDGSPGLRGRPMERIVEPLRQMGVEISATEGCAPINLKSFRRPLQALEYELPVASAQVKSCLLLASLAAAGATILYEPGPSRDHTERMLAHLGVNVTHSQVFRDGKVQYVTYLVPPDGLKFKPLQYHVPGDFSSAAFLIVGGLITPGSEIVLHEVGLNPTRVGLLEVLWEMGADVTISEAHEQRGEPVGDLHVRASRLQGTAISGARVVRMIDEFPALAVAASFGMGTTTVSQAEELRLKESDRISQLCTELSKLGVQVTERADGFAIQGGSAPRGGNVEAHGDHRLAMALSLMGLAGTAAVEVQGAEVIDESFPGYISTMQTLGAEVMSAP